MKLKKFFVSMLALMMALLLCACGADPTATPAGSDAASETETEIPEREIVLFGSDSDYRIIYSDDANTAVKDLLTQTVASIKAATGKAPAYATDTSKSTQESPQELLLGVTKREASTQSVSGMSALGYDIRFIGEKLVVTASNDMLLKKAVEALTASWTVRDGKIVLSNKTVLSHDASAEVRPLYADGAFTYKIIVPMRVSDTLYEAATYLSTSLSAVTGAIVDIDYDERVPETDGAYEICLGATTRKISRDLYASLDSVFSYKSVSEGNRIALGAKEDVIIAQAVRDLYGDLYNEIKYAYSGTPVISRTYGAEGTISEAAASLPILKAGTLYGMYQSSADKYVLYTENVTAADYEGYVNAIKTDGAALKKEYTLGENRYTLLVGEKYSAYVSYLPMENAIRTYVGPKDTLYDLNDTETVADVATPALWQLEVDNKSSMANGGMSYVIQLTDGSFVIIDGGYNTGAESENLYNLLVANTEEGKKPVITAWFITHLHTDHYGALINFASKYSNDVDVKGFYYNFPGTSVASSSNAIDSGVSKSVVAAMKRWKNAARYDTLHSGMTLGFAGATANVLCTHEDVYPMTFADGNDTCTVVKFTVAGQTVLFLADARDGESGVMLNTIPASVLKSDVVQFAHHGYEGCSEAFYRVVNAEVVLWPMNIVGYNSTGTELVFRYWYNNSMGANRFIRESETVKKIIVAGAGTQKLLLPYVPTGERVPDYEKIYNDRLSKQ